MIALWLALVVLGALVLWVGFWVGVKYKRGLWIARVRGTPNRHMVEGQVYYVLPENSACRECHVRRAMTEEGMAATATTRTPLSQVEETTTV